MTDGFGRLVKALDDLRLPALLRRRDADVGGAEHERCGVAAGIVPSLAAAERGSSTGIGLVGASPTALGVANGCD